ncbi:hypothetical protein [Streptomyces sp. NRRL F-5727]|uniref:hypothetical protein n=1 Tax=Streptomyces sp. NRRL F-5727 TaxID=1463871 RepID=UPI000562CC62|nr:hypothetical protein [Streptomyces sp. NRRL F-5727]
MDSGTRTPSDGYGRPGFGRALKTPDERTSPAAEGLADQTWPTDTQVWNWARSVTFAGYGPSPSDFL